MTSRHTDDLDQRAFGRAITVGRSANTFYTCQIPDPDDVESWIHTSDARHPTNPEASWCGMCCLQMILKAEDLPLLPLELLWEQAVDYGVYKLRDGVVKGAYHHDLAVFIDALGIPAFDEQRINDRRLRRMLGEGWYAIASVNPEIRSGKTVERKGGHLVLIYGFTGYEHNEVPHLLINNSTGFASNGTQAGAPIPLTRFREVFSGNVIFVEAVSRRSIETGLPHP